MSREEGGFRFACYENTFEQNAWHLDVKLFEAERIDRLIQSNIELQILMVFQSNYIVDKLIKKTVLGS